MEMPINDGDIFEDHFSVVIIQFMRLDNGQLLLRLNVVRFLRVGVQHTRGSVIFPMVFYDFLRFPNRR